LKNLVLILGNGFTIDFIEQLKKTDMIDVKNLFRLGHTVKFPHTNRPGFLSHRHCPSLWLLGARPDKNEDECMKIIEEIITCSNMLFDYLGVADSSGKREKLRKRENQSVYIKAYSELIVYLRQLFIDYNDKVSDDEINKMIAEEEWGWINYFKSALLNDEYEKVFIITYNYDIWLERILKVLKVKYEICGFEKKDAKVSIIKPHGSISFVPKNRESKMYEISYQIDPESADLEQIEIEYEDLHKYDKSFLIPPAGDSQRRQTDTWATALRMHGVNAVKGLKADDDVFICGMSYWHVDRKELDELLINLNQQINITLINPKPPKELNAVLVSLFSNYTAFTSSKTMKEVT